MSKILITGCNRGLGRALLENKRHEDVIIPCFRIKKEYKDKHIVGDINDITTLYQIEKIIKDEEINIVINNSAIYNNNNVLELTDQEIDDVITTNLLSQIKLLRRVSKVFVERNTGIIVNINSLAGKIPSAKESIYCASKAGLDFFSKALQIELIGTNVKVIDFYIGAMKTDMTKHRPNYNSLMEPKDVVETIYNTLSNITETSIISEVTIRKHK